MKDVKILGKDLKLSDVFEPEDKIINIMLPSNITPTVVKNLIGETNDGKIAFLYKNFPMFIDRTVLHVRKEDKVLGQGFVSILKSSAPKESLKEQNTFDKIKKILNESNVKSVKDYALELEDDEIKEFQRNPLTRLYLHKVKGNTLIISTSKPLKLAQDLEKIIDFGATSAKDVLSASHHLY